MSALTLLTAVVKYPSREPRNTKHGPRINVLVVLPDGEEARLWGDPGDPALTALGKGDPVQVVRDHKGVRMAQVASPDPTPAGDLSPADAEAAFGEILDRVAARYCKAIKAADKVARWGFNIDGKEGLEQAKIVKEIAAALFIEANKAVNR